ncbi:lariat debranching enzyme, C-terminal domain-containing protein [Roridomyces roridus]|uniref:Lariat debranching enzyme, C-terminal domain-containing protein n=1 Tax=Roridomyces roridus TaxID=1738132 RepID=A0AAD7BH80_9AGAR|nr:lariat debranching enzyme, C-terminal domain-containing protein [Roridomyces roridus]
MKVAVEGCCHGELDTIYSQIQSLESRNQYKVDLLLICGDFQAIRNHQDLQCMAVPDKYKQLGGFHRYYTGEKTAPILTIVIGGNHEASNYMWELYHGGWLAPNIYYLGEAGCVRVNGIRIAGASGIFKSQDFIRGHFEKMPYDRSTVRSIYHIREYSVRKLSLLSIHPQVFMSHDWPQSITDHGDLPKLLQNKPFFRNDIMSGQLGSPPLLGLLRTLQPDWWFAAHLHTRFEARVVHGEKEIRKTKAERDPNEIVIDDEDVDSSGAPLNPDEVALSDLEDEVAPPQEFTSHTTHFLALDKCGNKRRYLEVVDIDVATSSSVPRLTFDPEWLAISRAFHPFLSLAYTQRAFPQEEVARTLVAEARKSIADEMRAREPGLDIEDLEVTQVQEFVTTAPGPGHEDQMGGLRAQPPWYTNPQTVKFCELIGVENLVNPPPPTSTIPLSARQDE